MVEFADCLWLVVAIEDYMHLYARAGDLPIVYNELWYLKGFDTMPKGADTALG